MRIFDYTKKYVILLIVLLFAMSVVANANATAEDYIQKYKEIAIREMRLNGIPASITLAQGILESGIGTSMLAVKANNHFGIKCHKEWQGKTIKHTDDAPNECFRVYANAEESFKDHSDFLRTRPWYAPLFKLDPKDYVGWAHGLKKAGYATNPRYADMLIDVIERHQLYVYDLDIPYNEMENQRWAMKKNEKEELLVLHNAKTPISTRNVCVEASVPCTIPPNASNSVFYNNKLRTIHVQKGESLKSISSKHKLSLTKLYEYNDLSKNAIIQPGQLIYLQSKKNKARQKTHLVLSHETLWSISQNYGIKLEKLYERNFLKRGEEPAEGATVYLNKEAPKKPALRNPKQPASPTNIVVEMPMNQNQVSTPGTSTIKNTVPKTSAAEKSNHPTTGNTPSSATKTESLPSSNTSVTPTVVSNNQPNISRKVISHVVEKGDTLYNISKKYNVGVADIKEWNDIFEHAIQIGQILIIKQ